MDFPVDSDQDNFNPWVTLDLLNLNSLKLNSMIVRELDFLYDYIEIRFIEIEFIDWEVFMFLSRRAELQRMESFFASSGRAALVYGKRRVGKTRLVSESSKAFPGKIISYLCTKESYDVNLADLISEYCFIFNDSNRSFGSFPDFFRFLKNLDEEILVILDEYNNLKEGYGGVQTDSMMQKILDGLAGSKVKVVLLGSEITMMKELLDSVNPLFDRFDLTIHLEPFDYYDSALFFPDSALRWKVDTIAVFGGLPAALEQVDISSSLASNIKELFLEPEGRVRTLVERTIMQEYRKLGSVFSLLTLLGNGKRTYGELKEKIDPHNTGNLSKLLKKLIDNETVVCIHPINRKEDRKTTFYAISDNLLRFYFTYVHPNRSRIQQFGVDAVFEQFVEPSLSTYLSYRFEDIARSYFSRSVKSGLLKGVIDIGTYWYDDKKRHRNGEFDCAVSYGDGYDIFEVKHLSAPMDRTLADEEIRKIQEIGAMNVKHIGFVSLEGFSFTDPDYILISGKELFSPELETPACRKKHDQLG